MTEKSTFHAVLTGDIVKSRDLSPSDLGTIRCAIDESAKIAEGWSPGLVAGRVEFFRGDAWQLLLRDAAWALRVGVLIRAEVLSRKRADTRVAIGLGDVGYLSPEGISHSTGEAFLASGHTLDAMTLHWRMAIAPPKSTGPVADWISLVGHLCDAFIRQWTARQAEIVAMALDPDGPTHESIAGRLSRPVTKQAVTKSLDGANWRAIEEAIRLYEQTYRGVFGRAK